MIRAHVGVPSWIHGGILPPVDPNTPTSLNRSPYMVTLVDFISRFGNTEQRLEMLVGLLSFRSDLHKAGLLKGFQWINGSFIENIEVIEKRNPADIDLVTFFYLPDGQTQEELLKGSPDLFNPDIIKKNYYVHSYFVQVNSIDLNSLIEQAIYWYSVWSHRRNWQWKGFIAIDLSKNDDDKANMNLQKMMDGKS